MLQSGTGKQIYTSVYDVMKYVKLTIRGGQGMKTALFDMEVCLKERKERQSSFVNPREQRLKAEMRIVNVPELSRFRTRVVLNEVIEGKPLSKAIEKALAITTKK
jgi:hypothetical protein